MKNNIKKRLEYLRQEIEHERISYGEIAELESLSDYINKDDTLLLEWAGIKEDDETEQCDKCKKYVKNEKIYTTHEDNDHPDNQNLCEQCN